MANGRVLDFYPGGNTSLGFFSYYDYIITPDATRIFVIKGGPGVGKSSFMKKIATELNDQGFDVELHHCSSDPNSLDGLVFPEIGVALIDGTSPHVVDPRNPGAVDEILHLGDYWNEQGMREGKQEILALNKEVGGHFRRAYRYLKAASTIYEDQKAIYSQDLNLALANEKVADLRDVIFEGRLVNGKAGKIRKLFASAITPLGFQNFLATLIESVGTIYAVKGQPGTGKSTLLNKLAATALERGFDCEAFYCALDPYKLEHLVIPELDIAVTTAVEPHRIDINKATAIINMDECVNPAVPVQQGVTIKQNEMFFISLLEQAISNIAQAKSTHDKMEEYYIPNMNFGAIDELRQKTVARIIKYAEENCPTKLQTRIIEFR